MHVPEFLAIKVIQAILGYLAIILLCPWTLLVNAFHAEKDQEDLQDRKDHRDHL